MKLRESIRPYFDVGFDGGLGNVGKRRPIHESIAIAALIRSKVAFPPTSAYRDLSNEEWEYFRGIVWNDDPSCYLFNDKKDDNHEFSTGAMWLWDYEFGGANCMIQRSHFGNLQFLHGMGTEEGEKPEVTREKLVGWMEVMYKLACGNQDVSEDDELGVRLPRHFDEHTNPSGDKTMRDLLLASAPSYEKSNIQMRALGSCLHSIQDSYAIGHTQRRLRNPKDLLERDKDGWLHFKPGKHGDWGSVVVFHTYVGQTGSRHRHYDGFDGAPLPSPQHLKSFDPIIGARSAIAACIKLLDFYAEKVPWEDGVRQLLEGDIFALDPEAKPSNSFVDEAAGEALYCGSGGTEHVDCVYDAAFERKLARLEEGVLPSSHRSRKSLRRVVVDVRLMFVWFVLSMFLVYLSLQGWLWISQRP